MIFGEIASFISVVEKIKSLTRKSPVPESSITDRFTGIFKKHGVGLNQIPRFLDDGLSIEAVQSGESLLPYLTEGRLQRVCDLFAIKRAWLDGSDEFIYPEHHFYKNPDLFAKFLEDRKISYGYLLYPESKQDREAVLILKESIGFIENREIYRFYVESDWVFNYWKCRSYIASIFSMIEQQGGTTFYAQATSEYIRSFLAEMEEVPEIGFSFSKRNYGYYLYESLEHFRQNLRDDRDVQLGINLMRKLHQSGWIVGVDSAFFFNEFDEKKIR